MVVSFITSPFVIASCDPDILWLTGHHHMCDRVDEFRDPYSRERWDFDLFHRVMTDVYPRVLLLFVVGLLPAYFANAKLAVRRVELLILGFLFGFGLIFYVVDWQTWLIGYGLLWVYCTICPKHPAPKPAPKPDPEESFSSRQTKRLICAFVGAIVLVLGILITIGSYETLSGKLL